MILGWDACVRVPTCTFFNRSVGCRGGSGGVPLALARPPRATGGAVALPLAPTCQAIPRFFVAS